MPRQLTPKYSLAKNWDSDRRFREATRRVIDDNWTHARAAAWFGVSRPRVTNKVKLERERRANRLAGIAEGVSAAALSPLGLQEKRRVQNYWDFSDRYFSRQPCPDCREVHPTPPFHRQIVDLLDSPEKWGVINMPPYHGKSTLVTIRHTVWRLIEDPNWRRIIVSKSLPFARTFMRAIDQILTNPDLYAGGPSLIEELGPFLPGGDRKNATWNSEEIYVAGRVTPEKDPSVLVMGIGGQIYGRRADDIVFDDVATLSNQRNPAMVQQQLEWIDKEAGSRVGRNGQLRFVGTRVHPGDIYSVLGSRSNVNVLRFPAILDEVAGETLWPEHFPLEAAIRQRESMSDRDWQLVYQNVEIPGLGASFTEDMINQCKDRDRVAGQYDPKWRLVAGVDPAGGNKGSGYTAMVLEGVDMQTSRRYLIDVVNVKAMRAPQLKDAIFDWVDRYPIYTFRVETNGLQSQLIQYNDEIVKYLAAKGVRVEPHHTQSNKWDPQFGVESMAPLYGASMVSIPWGNVPSARMFQPLVEQLLVFPMGALSDVVMAHWFADLGCRDLLKRAHLPYFDNKMKVPERIRRKRIVVDFGSREVRRVTHLRPLEDRVQHRAMNGRPMPHHAIPDPVPEDPPEYVNVPGSPFDTDEVG